jgi:hypothetical protein
MSALIQIPLWSKVDEKDKADPAQPDGAFMLMGQIEVNGINITLRAGEKLGLAIRRNRNKQSANSPDYYGEVYAMTEPQGART